MNWQPLAAFLGAVDRPFAPLPPSTPSRADPRAAMGRDGMAVPRSPTKRRVSIGSRPVNYEAYAKMSTPQKVAVGRRYRRAVRVVPRFLALVVLAYAVALVAYFGKYRVRPRHHHAPDLPAVLREGEIETSSARRLLCSAAPLRYDAEAGAGAGGAAETRGAGGFSSSSSSAGGGGDDGRGASTSSSVGSASGGARPTLAPIKRGRFLGPSRAFAPPEDPALLGLNATDARVFLATGASASNPDAADLAAHFLDHYVHRNGVPREHVLFVVHTRGEMDRDATDSLSAVLERESIFHEIWEGEALLFSTVAHRWEHHLEAVADDSDWVIVADLDEHLAVPERETVPSFLGKVDQMGYSLVHGAWVDRVAKNGAMRPTPPHSRRRAASSSSSSSSSSLASAFPLQCQIGACGDPHHVDFASARESGAAGLMDVSSRPGRFGGGGGGSSRHFALHGLHHYSTLVGVMGSGQRVFAHRAQYPILDVRTLQDFGLDDVVTAARLAEDHESAYPVPLKVHHYQWRDATPGALRDRAKKYAACHLLEQENSVAGVLERLAESGGRMTRDVCPEITCYSEDEGEEEEDRGGRRREASRSSALKNNPRGGREEGASEKAAEAIPRGTGAGLGGGDSGGDDSGLGTRDSAAAGKKTGTTTVPGSVGATRLVDLDDGEEKAGSEKAAAAEEKFALSSSSPVPVRGSFVGNGGAPRGYGAERRVIIFASVWEHVDGVSRTMKRLAKHLKSRRDSQVFVLSPDLVEADFREAASSERFHVADVPHIPMPGRGEYKMAAPLGQRQRHQMETFAPHVVHVAAPDMLGHSAVRWAAENGVCSVCSYHTAYDTYLQFYRVGVLAAPLRQMLGGFYGSCDVVATPSYAAAEHLEEMGVPRERMGFFPRGVNRTAYSPARRSLAFRKETMGVGSREGRVNDGRLEGVPGSALLASALGRRGAPRSSSARRTGTGTDGGSSGGEGGGTVSASAASGESGSRSRSRGGGGRGVKDSVSDASESSHHSDGSGAVPTRFDFASGTEDGEVVILWIARIVREKGLGSFVKTIQELSRLRRSNSGRHASLPPYRVVVAGDGPDLPWMRRQLDHLPEVRILGHAGGDRLAVAYASGDVFFFPSRTEVFPNNLIEAMASGLAVVTDDVGVNRAIVKDGVTGVLVKDTDPIPGEVTAYVDALTDLLLDAARRRRLGEAARASTEGLTWERTFAALRRSYDRCRPGRPYARHLDPNIPGSKAHAEREAERGAEGGGFGARATGSGGGAAASASAAARSSVSGALLGISAHAAGGGGAAGALAAASAAFTPHHVAHASHHAGAAALAAAAAKEERSGADEAGLRERASDERGGSNGLRAGFDDDDAYDDAPRVPGAGPGAVNRAGVRERDVIVDDGAPPGSLLYRVSYGMTGGYARSLADARADDAAAAAKEAARREAAGAFAAGAGRWGGGGALGGGPGVEVGASFAAFDNDAEKY